MQFAVRDTYAHFYLGWKTCIHHQSQGHQATKGRSIKGVALMHSLTLKILCGQIVFVDLRPVPILAAPLDKENFWLLVNRVTNFDLSERKTLKQDVTSPKLNKVVSVLGRSTKLISFSGEHIFQVQFMGWHGSKSWRSQRSKRPFAKSSLSSH